MTNGSYTLAELTIATIYTKEANLVVEKGYIEIRAKSGLTIKITAKNLGDGLNRLISFFKELKKIKERGSQTVEGWAIIQNLTTLLDKHDIDLEGL